MIELGFYDFLFPFIITAALLFALLRKSKVLGESVQLNGVVALSIAFLVFGFPVLAGISLATPLATFFTQATVWVLIGVVGLLLASFFYPDLMGFLSKMMTSRSLLSAMLALAIALMVTSGLVTVFTGGLQEKPGGPPSPPVDVLIVSSAVIIFVVIILVASTVYSIKK